MSVDYKSEGTSTTVSCDTSDLGAIEEDRKRASAVVGAKRETPSDGIANSYQRRSEERPFGAKLSSIREEMREFRDNMDRFVDENKIVFENGEVEGFWGQKTANENLRSDPVDDREAEKTELENFAGEEDKSRWRNAEERKPKAGRIMRVRENEANGNFDSRRPKDEEGRTVDATNDYRQVYELMTLKTCPNVLPDSKETYPAREARSHDYEGSAKTREERSRGVFDSLFAELRCRDSARKTREPRASRELMILENASERRSDSTLTDTTTVLTDVDFNEQSNREDIVEEASSNSNPKIEILEDKFSKFSLESSEERNRLDESDDDSFKTATSFQEDTQVSEISRLPDAESDCNKIDSNKNENIESTDEPRDEPTLDEKRNNVILENKNEKTKQSLDRTNSRPELITETTDKPDSRVEPLVPKTDRPTFGRTNLSSRPAGKRAREAEDIQISNKRSYLVEKASPEGKPEERKTRSQISERCRQHLIQEAKKFTKKVSPLIDKCITDLMRDAENTSERSRYFRYGRRSLAEHPTIDSSSKMDFARNSGDAKGPNSCRDKREGDSNESTDARSAKQESTAKQTTDSDEYATLVDNFGKRESMRMNIQDEEYIV